MTRFILLLFFASASMSSIHSFAAAPMAASAAPSLIDQQAESIAPYVARFGRARPIIAILGENSGTVLSDFVIPYGVLAQSGVAQVVSVSTQAGAIKMSPLQVNPDGDIAAFDRRYPEGADYVVVPAVKKRDDPILLAWVSAQAAKGATMVSICNGSQVLANAGLLGGRRATGHWSTHKERMSQRPDTQWLKNRRYVSDGAIVSSAGITAAIPTSLALVEAIGGADKANAFAKELGVDYWGPRHDSEGFRLTLGDGLAALTSTVFRRIHDIGLPLAPGVDEITLALTAEAYSATLRGRVLSVAQSDAPVRTRGGLMIVPDRVVDDGKPLDWMLPESDGTPAGRVPQKLLKEIDGRYGASAARFVMLEWEYPWNGQ